MAADWAAAYGIVAGAMSGAAERTPLPDPPYWDGEIIEVDQRTFDIAVLTVRTDEPVPYLAGQSLAVEPTHDRGPGNGGGTPRPTHPAVWTSNCTPG